MGFSDSLQSNIQTVCNNSQEIIQAHGTSPPPKQYEINNQTHLGPVWLSDEDYDDDNTCHSISLVSLTDWGGTREKKQESPCIMVAH